MTHPIFDYAQREFDEKLYTDFGITTDEYSEYVSKNFGFNLHKSLKVEMNNIDK